MEDKILTPADAWNHFFDRFKDSDRWNELDEWERHALRATHRSVLAGTCGSRRIQKALERYAPGRYRFVDLSGFKLVD